MMTKDTICAISTAPGKGGCRYPYQAVTKRLRLLTEYPSIRTKKCCRTNIPHPAIRRIKKKKTANYWMKCERKFVAPTLHRKDTIEISCHGSLYIQQRIIELLIRTGCRLAQPGEFTRRAFSNGKMDLSQAEAVADLIASTSAATHRLAINQMRGDFSNELAQLRTRLLDFASLIELELDFSEEEVEFADRDQLNGLSREIEQVIRRLSDSFHIGNAIKNGIPTAIIGETNAGKSTLLNRLVHEEKALVSDIHGTTRDVIEDTFNIQGITFRFIDTAGIRDTQDKIESMGIERTYKKLEQADIVLWLIDATGENKHITDVTTRIRPRCEEKKLIILLNKLDRLSADEQKEKEEFIHTLLKDRPDTDILFISASENQNIDRLEQLLITAAHLPESGNDIIVTNARHYEALLHALQSITRVQEGLTIGLSGDFLAQDIRECLYYIGTIVGEVTTEDILKNIFSKFCIGK
ncbi:MAG: tRNA uridine-5-carboxymethylaminomethyl(34) synthesis GTPase MnmE [Barnesiella sp.]